MAAMTVPPPLAARVSGAAALLWLLAAAQGHSFPLDSATDPGGPVPAGTELAAPDANDLRHQLQLATGLAAPGGGGWTIVPRVDVEAMFNDNILQQHSPRRWDLITLLSPGIAIAGDEPRVQMAFDYSPTLSIYARTGPENALTQQLNGTALVTMVQDLAYLDLRANSGVTASNGLVGGGAGGVGGIGTANGTAAPTSGTAGLSKANRSQIASFEISPYLVQRFGDIGSGKIGVSATKSDFDSTTGFAPAPFPAGGGNGTSLLTTEQFAKFTSGDILEQFQDVINIDLTQSTSRTNQLVNFTTGATTAVPSTTATSRRVIASDQLNYAVNPWAMVFVSIGHEDISYSQRGARNISGLTWQVGTTLEPNPDSQITVSYGHQNGTNAIQGTGHYALTARTTITGSYTNTIGTALEQAQHQLQQEAIGSNGQPINGANGAPLVINQYVQGNVQAVYRYSTISFNVQTTLDRDVFTATLVLGTQTSTGGTASQTTSKSGAFQWQHALNPDLLLNTSMSYTTQVSNGGEVCFGSLVLQCASNGNGNTASLAAGAVLQYTMTDTLSSHLRYAFYDRMSPVVSNRIYQSLIIAGFTKTF